MPRGKIGKGLAYPANVHPVVLRLFQASERSRRRALCSSWATALAYLFLNSKTVTISRVNVPFDASSYWVVTGGAVIHKKMAGVISGNRTGLNRML
jgi:hypothetical protein